MTDKEIIHETIMREIVSKRAWCVCFAGLGSKVCQKHAKDMGWVYNDRQWATYWHGEQATLTESERLAKKKKQNEQSRANYWKHRDTRIEQGKKYRARLKEERKKLKGGGGECVD